MPHLSGGMQVIQADRYTVCLRLRTSTAATPKWKSAASAAAGTDEEEGEGEWTDGNLDRTEIVGGQSEHEGGKGADPSIDPFMDMQQGKLPWPWLRSPPGTDRGGPLYRFVKAATVKFF